MNGGDGIYSIGQWEENGRGKDLAGNRMAHIVVRYVPLLFTVHFTRRAVILQAMFFCVDKAKTKYFYLMTESGA